MVISWWRLILGCRYGRGTPVLKLYFNRRRKEMEGWAWLLQENVGLFLNVLSSTKFMLIVEEKTRWKSLIVLPYWKMNLIPTLLAWDELYTTLSLCPDVSNSSRLELGYQLMGWSVSEHAYGHALKSFKILKGGMSLKQYWGYCRLGTCHFTINDDALFIMTWHWLWVPRPW